MSPMQESHPLCSLKNPTVIYIWLLVGFHPVTQSTPTDNTRKRVWQYIEKDKKQSILLLSHPNTLSLVSFAGITLDKCIGLGQIQSK